MIDMEPIPTRYNPKETEDKWYKSWEENNLFAAKPDPAKKPFCIVIPPPNVTGILHMGHALNNTVQDILIRCHRMRGEESLWMPGTDHAGIATQNVVEKAIAKEGLTRGALGREKFIERVWQWKEQYGSTIIKQLKKLGASCDWPRTRFTMDEEYSRAVIEVFVRLYEKGLIYQGSYIINWCPRCQTALADEEAPHQEVNGSLYYIRYPLKKSGKTKFSDYIVVATTRPETMLGDTAVAVNPKDNRYKHLIGETAVLPLLNREIKIIADEVVDVEFGTGAVKVTPAHDPDDYVLGKNHSLEFINVMHPDGRMNENAEQYSGMDRFAARKLILEQLEEKGLIDKIEPHKLSAGHCYRCHTITEPYLSKQWFVRMKPLAQPAIEAVKQGKITFYPERWTKVYLNWMENIRDWCISRQIWWGHRLPVYYCDKCRGIQGQKDVRAERSEAKPPRRGQEETGIIVSRIKPDKCPHCGSTEIHQDEDVLDTWFSSWLWPFATFGWPPQEAGHPAGGGAPAYPAAKAAYPPIRYGGVGIRPGASEDLKYFYPTSVLVTAPEIIFFWVARMIMAGLEFMGDIPFKDVYIHGTVRDIEGKKMSKSLGNVIDPLAIIDEYGADALRFSLIAVTAHGQDVFLSKERFEQGRNFANKIWNASRFIMTNLDTASVKADLCAFFKNEDLNLINRWILSRFYSALKEVDEALGGYHFNEAANIMYGFFWHEFCDWYLEIIKPDIKNPSHQTVMFKILEKTLRVLHPFMPFITEEIWHRLFPESGSIMASSWPHIQEQIIDARAEAQAQALFEVITKIRNLRLEIDIKPEQKVTVSVYPHTEASRKSITQHSAIIAHLSRLETLNILEAGTRPQAAVSDITEDVDLYLHFNGLVEISKEQKKIKERLISESKRWEAKKKLMDNADFVKKAEPQVVENLQKEIKELEDRRGRLERLYNELL